MTRRGETRPKVSGPPTQDMGSSFVKKEVGWSLDLRSWLNAAHYTIQAPVSGAAQGFAIGKQVFATVVGRITSTAVLFGIGVVLASGLHMLFFGHQSYEYLYSLSQRHAAFKWILGNKEYAYLAVGAAIAAFLPIGYSWLKRLVTSWIYGVVGELPFVSFCTAVAVFTPSSNDLLVRCIVSLTVITLACLLSHHLRGYANWLITKGKMRARVSIQAPPRKSPDLLDDSDDPVTSWEDDLLDRPPLVDLLSIKVLALKKPVVILDGRFGAGKSTVLNLLRLRLKDEAIVVSFSAWLPGSENTLTDFLVSDIVTECRKRFVVPGLARSARRFMNALAKSVPYLMGLAEFLPTPTQLDVVNQLKSSLRRIPMRVVVLIDEVDRMQKAEILALLKLLRGVAGVPNLSFVCACDKDEVMRRVGSAGDKENAETREYFEKFFLDEIPISEPTSETLELVGIGRIVRTLNACESFISDTDEQKFESNLATLWPKCFAPFCCNLRKIGIVANDLHGAITLLGRDVSYTDLALITLLRRMNPQVHALVSNQPLILTGGFKGLKQYRYLDENERSRRQKRFVEEVGEHCASEEDKKTIHAILSALFPLFPKFLGHVTQISDQNELEKSVRISNPWMFVAYFRYELPKEVFGASALEEFLQSVETANEQREVSDAFRATLESMEIGSERREDFMWKISLSIGRLNRKVASWLTLSVMQYADRYVYDRDIRLWGESAYAFRVARETLLTVPESERIDFLRDCVSQASDDTMAYWLIRRLTDLQDSSQEEEESLRFPLRAVWDAFIGRMRSRYGSSFDVTSDEAIRTSDPDAFALWGSTDLSKWSITAKPSDREMRDNFWLNFIGHSKERLARIFETFFLPRGQYTSDPAPFVEQRVSLALLRHLNLNVSYAPELTKEEAASLRRIDRLLKGDYKDGVPIGEWQT